MSKNWESWYKPKSKEDNFFRSYKKYKNLISTVDYSKPENQFDFIGRNLVDTRYVTKEILSALKNFLKQKIWMQKLKL